MCIPTAPGFSRCVLSADEASRELVRDYVVEDSAYLDSTYIGQNRQGISPDPYRPFDCTELSGKNNVRPETPGF